MSIIEDSKEIFENIKKVRPVMHNISNIVTANDCANITLACGGSPTMADDPDEVEDITSACNGFVLNMGNTGGFMVETMLRAGKKSNEVNHPTVLDPVGAGAAKRRNQVLETLLKEIKFAGSKTSGAKGVDAAEGDKVTEENLDEMVAYAKNISAKLGSVIAMSGAIDIVADENTAYIIRNGHSMMSDITGTGCMLSSVVGVFISANPDNILKATAVALSAYGLAGELAYKKTMEMDGYTSTLRMNLIDYMGKMNAEMLQEGAKIEVR